MSEPKPSISHIIVNIAEQSLTLYQQNDAQYRYRISTAKNGAGNQQDSGCTPLGQHIIAKKIGADMPINTVFVGRVPTGEIYNDKLGAQHPKRDWILSRILWLSGLEEGLNRGNNAQGSCDSFARYIYIHGTPDSEPMGIPYSHGCIRMRNQDLLELFDAVKEGTPVTIVAS